jgi:hypothetical protein
MSQNKIHQRHNSRQPVLLPKEARLGANNEENRSPEDIDPANSFIYQDEDQGED